MINLLRTAIFLSLVLFTATAYANPAQDYQRARADYLALLKDAPRQQYRHHWDKVLSKLNQFAERYPGHDKAASARFLLANGYRQLYGVSLAQRDARSAVAQYQQLVRTQSQSSLADDALLAEAEIEHHIFGNSAVARQRCEQLLRQYPGGDMVAKTRQLLASLPESSATAVAAATIKTVAPGLNRIQAVRHWSDDQQTRLVIEMDRRAEFKVNTLPASQKDNSLARLYVDIQAANLAAGLAASPVPGGKTVKDIRLGENPTFTRVVFDLEKIMPYTVQELQDPARIVIDMASRQDAVFKADIPEYRAPSADIASVLQDVPEDVPMRIHLPDVCPKQKGQLRIVVDAGHGGKDPGAIGPGNLYEKDVVLNLAKRLASQLRTELKCEVLLTRDKDIYIPLQQRTAYANSVNADLFISVHANASLNKDVHGVETYYLNFSKNDKAVAVAARENGMSMQEVGDLELILFDLMANAKINESSRLAAEIQAALLSSLRGKYRNVNDLGVRQGPFHVLLGATMPSVLVEVAFISNKEEAKRLKSRSYQEQAAQGIVAGVTKYLHTQKLSMERVVQK